MGCATPHDISMKMAFSCRLSAVAASIGLWFERIPSASNVADWPSRGQRDALLKAGARECELLIPPDLKDLVKLKTL